MNTIYSHYSFDECKNEDELFDRLDALVEEGKITYVAQDKYILKIEDLDLTSDEVGELLDLFDSLDVFEYYGHQDDDEDYDDFDQYDDEEDDYGSTKRRKDDDDYDDY
jgi:hypothetical protein